MTLASQANNDFLPGTFCPENTVQPQWILFIRQTQFDTLSILRNSEQLLLTIIIPAMLLIVLTTFHIGHFSVPSVQMYLTMCLTLAIIGSGFTGQAIAVAFDRRYGVLKWLGTTALPKWEIIATRCAAVANTVVIQCSILWIIAFCLAWHPTLTAIFYQICYIFLGSLVFTTFGFLLGGTLKSEIVLGLANLLWFIFLMLSTTVIYFPQGTMSTIIESTPPGALTAGLVSSTAGKCNILDLLILLGWIFFFGLVTKKLFRYTT